MFFLNKTHLYSLLQRSIAIACPSVRTSICLSVTVSHADIVTYHELN